MPPDSSPNVLVPSPSLPPLTARFAWSDKTRRDDLTVNLFRRTFELAVVPASQRIIVTADSRYVLWLNGQRLGRGPLKGTLLHYHAETYELASLLQPGTNVLAAEVRWFGRSAPLSEVHGPCPGWFVQGLDDDSLDTPGAWRAWADTSVSAGWDDPYDDAHVWLGPLDRIDAAQRPVNWMAPDFDDAAWPAAIQTGGNLQPRGWGEAVSHHLEPRSIPALIEEPRDFPRLLLDRQPTDLPWIVPADTAGELWLDAGSLTTSYPVLDFVGGAGREVRIVYAEALGHWEEKDGQRVWGKRGRRDDITTLDPHGYRDVLTLPGGDHTFEPFHWRTFWFIKLEIPPGPEPVTLRSGHHRFTTYPQDFTARFTCPDPDIKKLWSISLRTLQLCAHETYEDCPYFEQLNYTGDTRLQAMCSRYLANDSLLGRRCIQLFRESLGANGLTASRVPSHLHQIIPAFSLHWILMLNDHWQWEGEPEAPFICDSLGAVDAILRNFRDHLTPDNFVGAIDEWRWIDWVPEWPKGVSPVAEVGGGSTYLTAFFVMALEAAAELHLATGHPAEATRWLDLAEELRGSLRTMWSESDGLFIEGPGREADPLTQHAQTMVLLAGVATDAQKKRIGTRLLDKSDLVQMSLFQRFYLAKAAAQIDHFDEFFPAVLGPWREMLHNGLSTWQEMADPCRSDCHAWSSWITIAFLADILGAKPGAPGWKKIHIEPQFAATDSASGEFTSPVGLIRIAWAASGINQVDLTIESPAGVPVTVSLPTEADQHFASGGLIKLSAQRIAS